MTPRAVAAVALLSLAGAARGASPFPTRNGESGILDVPDALPLGSGTTTFSGELRLDRAPGIPDQLGPFPLAIASGLGRWDVGLGMREGGRPGDPRPSALLFTGSVKRAIVQPGFGPVPLAAELALDRFNRGPVGIARLVASVGDPGHFRMTGYAGWEAFGATGPAGGVAVAVPLPGNLEAVAQAAGGPRGGLVGGALRWQIGDRLGLSAGVDWLPREEGFRFSLGIGVRAVPERRAGFVVAEKRSDEEAEAAPKPGEPVFLDDRPHFRLRIGVAALRGGEPRHQQIAPYTGPTAIAAAAPKPAAPVAAAPTAEDMLEAQVRDQEVQAEARSKRLLGTEESLASRDSAVAAAGKRLADRDRDLAAREQQLDERERQLRVRGPVPPAERQLEATEAQLGATERQLQAQARGFQPAIDAADGREHEAEQRGRDERAQSQRLLASAQSARSRGEQIDLRKQALAARQRQLAADEARLVAKGERLDALERQLRAREEALDAWQRRLDTKGERLDLVAARAAALKRAAEPPPKPATEAAPPKDKSVFVMVVKSPTAILKEGSGKANAPAEGAGAGPLHPGIAVEKAVAAATVLYFPTPASQLSELDREGLENIARLAAKEGCEVLVWARAKDPSLMPEATRRSSEIKALLVKLAGVPEKQVVTRITTRPGAQGVDVVVSALRGQSGPAAPAGTPAAPAAAGTAELGTGETAKRQLREAVQSYQRDIERCIGLQLVMRRLDSAEVVLKLSVDASGKVTRAAVEEGPLAGEEVRACLGSAAKKWAFPQTGAEYAVDVPITVVAPGKKP